MRASSKIGALVLAAALGGAVVAPSCGFPEIQYAMTSSSTVGGGGGEGGAGNGGSASGGLGGLGGLGGAGGAGGLGGAGGMGGLGGAGGAGGGVVNCDVDRDGYDAILEACPGGNDCDDNDPDVHPNQGLNWFDTMHPVVGFDWDCSGAEEREFNYFSCSGGLCTATQNVFLENAACGTAGAFGNCTALCQMSGVMARIRRCR